MSHTDDWSWFDAPELSDVDLSGHTVTAVLVCRNAASWLNATLAGIGQLDRRPEIIIAVDNESTDDTTELLEAARGAGLIDHVIDGKANASFGQAVELALSVIGRPTQWIWMLHDDAVPDQNALTELLQLAARTPRLAIAVPLLVRPSRRNHAARTLEVGASITASGRRALGLEPDEVAQGQYESSPVLGGSTCGMLIKWDSLIRLGGFDRCISAYRDGVDLGWRAHLIGEWVLTCPKARIVHRQVGRSEIRESTIARRAARSEAAWDRLMGLRLVAAHARGFARIGILVQLTFVCLFSALVYVLGRVPDRAKDELQAWSDFIFRSRKPVKRLREIIKRVSHGSNTVHRVRSLRPTLGSVVDDGFQSLVSWVQGQWSSNNEAEITLDDLLGDEFTRRLGEGRKRIPIGVWMSALVAGILIMGRHLYQGGMVTAPGLLGTPDSLMQGFQYALSGLGEPWLLVSAATAAVALHPQWFPVFALLTYFPITMGVAVWFARRRIEHSGLRWLAAGGYALVPVLMGGLNRGALWLVLLAVILPFMAEWISRIPQPWMGARTLQTLAGISLAGLVIVAITPVLWIPVIAISIIVALNRGGTARLVRTVVALVLPFLFWAQSIPYFVANPSRLLLTPEAMLTDQPLTWEMFFARPFVVGAPPQWLSLVVFSALWAGVIVVMIRDSKGRWLALIGAGCITVGMWFAQVSLPMEITRVQPDPSAFLLVGFSFLVYAVAIWIDQTLNSVEGKDFGATQALIALVSLLIVVAFLLGGVWSAYGGMSEVVRGPSKKVPEYLAHNEMELDTGTLIINGATRTWNLRYEGQTTWGQGSILSGPLQVDSVVETFEQIVARAVEGRADDSAAAELATAGVSVVVVLNANADTVIALDTTAGFQRMTTGGDTEIWAVTSDSLSPTRRALVTEGDPVIYLGARDPVPPGKRTTLVLAQPSDPNLHVFVGDQELRPTTSGDWRAAYTLGGASGEIRLSYTIPRMWTAWIQLAFLAALIIFVVPPLTSRDEDEDGVPTRRRTR
ncbi:MAG: glycosyltransferase [Propionibacteriaceae bacterium]|jgi:GT2 family glycosyltransferase|nr:glycosyltransferase [Propionibacteriaceae bacterium]